jgi:hypothetical protein
MSHREIMQAFYSGNATFAETIARLEAWKNDGEWIPGCNRTEVPFISRSGVRLLWCYQPRSGRHAYLNCDTDMILSDEEATRLMQV